MDIKNQVQQLGDRVCSGLDQRRDSPGREEWLEKHQLCGLKTGKVGERGSALQGGRKGPEQAIGFGDRRSWIRLSRLPGRQQLFCLVLGSNWVARLTLQLNAVVINRSGTVISQSGLGEGVKR